MSKFRVLVTHPDVPESGLKLLKKSCELVFLNSCTSQSDFTEKSKDVDALFVFGGGYKIGKEFADQNTRVKVVGLMSVGYDPIDVNYLKCKNIKVSNVPGTLDNCVAEVAICLALNVGHRMKEGFNKMLKGEWEKNAPQWLLGQDITDSNFGIIGLGNIGKTIAKRAFAFEPKKILYTGRTEKPYAKEFKGEFTSLDTLLSESDFIIISCPLSPETKHLINKTTINKMKKNAIIINVARGEIVKQEDLYEALKNNRIMGAGLDVMTPEPIDKNDPILQLDNCVLTPHIGSATFRTRSLMADLCAENILAALEGKKMPTPL